LKAACYDSTCINSHAGDPPIESSRIRVGLSANSLAVLAWLRMAAVSSAERAEAEAAFWVGTSWNDLLGLIQRADLARTRPVSPFDHPSRSDGLFI
jgi:hypothetical protein